MIRPTILLLALLLSSTAFAQPRNADSPGVDAELDDAARITFQRARTAFDAGDYETALARFRQAYELSPRPQLLYNIAATLDRLRRDVEAVAALRAFLEASPDTPDRVEIEARIRVLDGIIQQREDQETAAQEAEEQRRADEARRVAEAEAAAAAEEERQRQAAAAQAEASSGLHPAIAISVGGAALVAGGLIIWSGLDASKRNDTFNDYVDGASPSPEARAAGQVLYDETRSAETRTNVLIGVAAGLGVAAGVLFAFTNFGGGDDDDEDGVVLRGGATHQGGSVMLEGTF